MSTIITVPDRMSCVNVIYCLWQSSNLSVLYKVHPYLLPTAQDMISTPEKALNFLKKNKSIHSFGGRLINVDFSDFPRINIEGFDREYGIGAAETVIISYSKLEPKDRFDKNDLLSF